MRYLYQRGVYPQSIYIEREKVTRRVQEGEMRRVPLPTTGPHGEGGKQSPRRYKTEPIECNIACNSGRTSYKGGGIIGGRNLRA